MTKMEKFFKLSRLFLMVLLFSAGSSIFAQIYPDKYLVEFTDKNNSPYLIEDPEEFLSARAIERREKFNIPIIENDLPVNPQYLQAVEDIGVTLLNPTKWFNAVTIYTDDPGKIAEIEDLPFVKNVLKNIIKPVDKNLFDLGNEISLNKPGQMNEVFEIATIFKNVSATSELEYGEGYNQINMINGIELHNNGFMGQGMLIAVLDAGFSSADVLAAFDSLRANDQIIGTRDFVSGGNFAYHGSYHGTAVLSTMGANLPGQLIGTAPKADYLLIRTEDTGSEYLIEEYNWASGAEFADSAGADIINSSLSYTTFDDPSQNHSYEDMDGNTAPVTIAADIAASKGMIPVNSAGNSGGSPTWPHIGAPADGDSVFTIGAVNPEGEYASFSSTGPTYDGRLKPNFMAQGQNAAIALTNGGVGTSSGTSFSSPIIAGMTSCLWQANPYMSNMDILAGIEQSGSLANNPNYQMGHGIPDYALANLILTGFNPDLVANENDIDVFPNPFVNEVKIVYNSPDTQMVNIEIFDINGRRLFSRENIYRKKGINYYLVKELDNLNSGVYFLKIYSAKKIIATEKILKARIN